MKKILLVDDCGESRGRLKKALEEDFILLEAENAYVAEELVLKESPDMMICDYNMPEVNGLELIRKIKAEKKLQNIPFAMCTTERQEELRNEGLRLGVKAWITKPIHPESFRTVIGRIVEKYS